MGASSGGCAPASRPPSPWQMMVNVPLFAGNPQLQEQLRLQLPVFLQQVSGGPEGGPEPRRGAVGGLLRPARASPPSARFPADAEPGVALRPHQPPCHAGAAADPAGAADPADRGPRAGAQVRVRAGGQRGPGSSSPSSRPLPLPLSAASPPLGLCLQPRLLRDGPDARTRGRRQHGVRARGPRFLAGPAGRTFSSWGVQCAAAAAHATDDPALGRKRKLTGAWAAGPAPGHCVHPGVGLGLAWLWTPPATPVRASGELPTFPHSYRAEMGQRVPPVGPVPGPCPGGAHVFTPQAALRGRCYNFFHKGIRKPRAVRWLSQSQSY